MLNFGCSLGLHFGLHTVAFYCFRFQLIRDLLNRVVLQIRKTKLQTHKVLTCHKKNEKRNAMFALAAKTTHKIANRASANLAAEKQTLEKKRDKSAYLSPPTGRSNTPSANTPSPILSEHQNIFPVRRLILLFSGSSLIDSM